MSEQWSAVILLGLAAGFIPTVLGLEILILGANDGVKRTAGLLSGITLFRLFMSIFLAVLLAGAAVVLIERFTDMGRFVMAMASRIGMKIVAGEFIITDMLLIASGIMLLYAAFRHVRHPHKDQAAAETENKKNSQAGFFGMLIAGMVLTLTNVNQWVFFSAAVGHILDMEYETPGKFGVLLLTLLLANLLLLLPIIAVLLQPERGQALLVKVNGWVHGAMAYVVALLLAAVGLFFIFSGGRGIVNFLNR